MRIAFFSTKSYDRSHFMRANEGAGHELVFFEARLSEETVALARGFEGVCVFVNDQLDRTVLDALAEGGVRFLALRSAGYNHVDIGRAAELGLVAAHVPAYSPHAVAEHTLALILALNRKIHRAYNRVREGNFSLDGLMGFDLHGRTIGIVGTGNIGQVFARMCLGLGSKVIACDPYPTKICREMGVDYVELEELFGGADVISLHCPLTPETKHVIDAEAVEKMKEGVMLINTSRGALVDTRAVIDGLKSGKIGYLGLDVYEEETELFFEDLSDRVIQDDVFARLLTFPNVVITGHQGFFTTEAVTNIAETTIANITAFETGAGELNTVPTPQRS
ncbi:MAG: 2-hydroxyacid dehydrogenase [Bradymonadaceae bacterium]